MTFKSFAKAAAPPALLRLYRKLWARRHQRRALARIPAAAQQLHKLSTLTTYDVELPPDEQAARDRVEQTAKAIYGDAWNYHSDALRPEIVRGFGQSIEAVAAASVSYLEIGSCQGLSMGLIGTLLRDRASALVSVDPYFDDGYIEGANGPYETEGRVRVTKRTRVQAASLYAALALPVEQIEATSLDGLAGLIRAGRTFDLIYIDGAHEALWPVVDFGLCRALLAAGSVLILDDHLWPDVQPLKQLCDKHLPKVQETWKTASYKFE